MEPAPTSPTTRVKLQWLARGLLAAVVGTVLAVSIQLPRADLAGAGLTCALLLPATLVAAALSSAIAWVWRFNRHLIPARLRPTPSGFALWGTLASVVGTVLGVGLYLSNVLLIDPPLGGWTLIGYGLSALVAAAASFLGVRLLRSPRGQAWVARIAWRRLSTLVLLAIAALAATLDSSFYSVDPNIMLAVHLVLGPGSVVAMTWAAYFLVKSSLRAPVLWATGAAVALFVVWPVARGQSLEDVVNAIEKHRTIHRRVLYAARALLDRDHDGYSARLGGGDCDDDDPQAYPLSRGRDCLGWRGLPPPSSPPTVAPPTSGPPPRVILLVTVDTLRCGMGAVDRPELRHACPSLTRLGQEGLMSLEAHTVFPATVTSMAALQRVTLAGERSQRPLGEAMRGAGYETSVIMPLDGVLGGLSPAERAAYGRIEERFLTRAEVINTVTSGRITDVALEQLRGFRAGDGKWLLWVHYFDPHAPYLDEPGSHWVASSAISRYVKDVGRADAEIRRLVDKTAAMFAPGEVAVVVTADHGEEFHEHGASHHHANLFEPTTRIPLAAWRSGPDHRAGLPTVLPAGIDEVGEYVLAMATGRPFSSAGQTCMSVHRFIDDQIGVFRDGWKLVYHRSLNLVELFDVRHDPDERTNLADREPARLRDLAARLARCPL